MPIFKGRPPGKKRPSRPGGRPGGKPSGKLGKAGGKFGKPSKKKRVVKKKKAIKKAPAPSLDSTGMEGLYFKELIQAEAPVVVVLDTGEEVLGFVRYYDLDMISIAPADGSPKMFLRKSGIRYLYEAEEVEDYEDEEGEE